MMQTSLVTGGANDPRKAARSKENHHAVITVTYSSVRKAPSLKTEIASAVSDLTARILRKDPKVTAIIVR